MAKITSTTTIRIRTINKTVPIKPPQSGGSSPTIISALDNRRMKDAALPEYDPLADFYDIEYSHDYDVPFWLSLAEREGGPIVEWGGGWSRAPEPHGTRSRSPSLESPRTESRPRSRCRTNRPKSA